MGNTSIIVECEKCKHQIKVDGDLLVKKEYETNGQLIFLTYFNCPNCNNSHFVQIDNSVSMSLFEEVEKQLIRLAKLKAQNKVIPQKQLAKFKKAREHLAHSRNELMKQYTGKLIHDSDTDSEFELRFSV